VNGARQFVVQEAFEMMLCSGLSCPQLTPRTTVKSTSFPGAEMMTFFAPALMCFPAPSRSRNTPVHSSTMSTPRSAQGRFSGSRSDEKLTICPSISTPFSEQEGVLSQVPKFESYLSKWQRASLSAGSFTATRSKSSAKSSIKILKHARPILPKPLIATFGFIWWEVKGAGLDAEALALLYKGPISKALDLTLISL